MKLSALAKNQGIFIYITVVIIIMTTAISALSNTLLPYLKHINGGKDCLVILGSQSPRRKELLKQIGITDFRVRVSSFVEDLDKVSDLEKFNHYLLKY